MLNSKKVLLTLTLIITSFILFSSLSFSEEFKDSTSDFSEETNINFEDNDEELQALIAELLKKQPVNLVLNPQFEHHLGGDILYWLPGDFYNKRFYDNIMLSEKSFTGENSLLIENHDYNFTYVLQRIPVEENSFYKISVHTKVKDLDLRFLGANIQIPEANFISEDIRVSSSEWRPITIYAQTGQKQDRVTLKLSLGSMTQFNKGSVLFDNVRFEKIESIPSGFETVNLYSSDYDPLNLSMSKKIIQTLLLLLTLISIIMFLSIWIYRGIKKERTSTNVTQQNKFISKNLLIDTSISLIFFLLAISIMSYNLGSKNVPTTGWTPRYSNESITVEFDKEVALSRISYYVGYGDNILPEGRFVIQSLNPETEEFEFLTSMHKYRLFQWIFTEGPPINVKALRIICEVPGAELLEMAFWDGKGNQLTNFKIVESSPVNSNSSSPKYIFDEQEKASPKADHLNSSFHDEFYHVRTAYEYVNNLEPEDTTHPPLGRWIISFGIMLFGMVPFGFRIPGVIFAGFSIVGLYFLGKKIFNNRFFAGSCSLLFLLDFMTFTQSRIGLIDIYPVFATIMLAYFSYTFIDNFKQNKSLYSCILPLFLCSIFVGFAFASKWNGAFVLPGIALSFALLLFDKYLNVKPCQKSSSSKRLLKKSCSTLSKNSKKLYTLIALSFMTIPILINIIVYIPYVFINKSSRGFSHSITNWLYMLRFQTGHDVSHSRATSFWEWPLVKVPMDLYTGIDMESGRSSVISTMGNPAIWWLCIPAFIICTYLVFKKKDFLFGSILLMFLSTYLTWMLIELNDHVGLIYYFFTSVPFVVLMIVYIFKHLAEYHFAFKYVFIGYILITLVFFLKFYPVISGYEVSSEYIDSLKWLDSWKFNVFLN